MYRTLAARAFSTTPAAFVPNAAATTTRSPLRRLVSHTSSHTSRGGDLVNHASWPGLSPFKSVSGSPTQTARYVVERRQGLGARRWIRASASAPSSVAGTAASDIVSSKSAEGALRPPSIVDENGDMATHVGDYILILKPDLLCGIRKTAKPRWPGSK